ncbi:tripartite tricarboxylate transporter substrate binding protein [Rhodovarius crocodyli]|uniref:Tripartite tricarboxylate transporter substrate binding protein n=1 Tax=Rhodovarius crocodyli TaxID=1979269 RepID=A0A437MHH4_9PROT|nr:tripartite tricarboxylate transporter substrate binding protein [Rhodovarius crocodyli]RVT97097.1 tripartite tricarboxylate transporter substrate binding protein [Rhodovarius crocodyli]
MSKIARRGLLARSGLVLPLLSAPSLARAQGGFPNGPIKLIVPFAPGGSTDLVARLIATPLSEKLGAAVTIDNRAGAGATVGSIAVQQSAPDGQTLLLSNIASQAIAPFLYPGLRYDVMRDFTHIAMITTNPSVFVANKDSGIRTMADVARVHRAAAEGIDMASSGVGSSNHMLIVMLGQLLGKPVNHIPFRGAGPAMTAVLAGQVPLMSDSLPSSVSHLRQGSVRAIGMASPERHPLFPDIPTLREQGYDLASTSWFGLSGPAGMQPAVVERLNREVSSILSQPDIQLRFRDLGGTAQAMQASEFQEFVRRELDKWGPVVRASGARVE